ncbi:GGDEF domain-containing protein [Paludisphaera soli]|uniref:GGDEF domain-containing protein n=1 Tax=Paludisphaera soli TaxID=2712865 RepID=UPI0013EB7E69|nr:diguanylate cyclase [Paludisphaera soli]
MQTERGWRWDDPTSFATATLAPRANGDAEAERRASAESAVHDFVATAAVATDLVALCEALATAARRASGEDGVAVVLESGEPGPASGASVIPIRVGEGSRSWGRLELDLRGSARPAVVTRRLESLATLAAIAIERIRRDRRGGPSRARDSSIHDAGLLGTVVPFALSQARRHKEPLSILFLAIDRLRGVRELMGPDEADRVVGRVGVGIAGLLRSSDLVGRLDDDRLMAVLPRSELHDARRVGEKLCRGIAAAEDLLGIPMEASLSIGVASFPASGTTLGELLDAAEAALDEARTLGPGRVVAAPPVGIARD